MYFRRYYVKGMILCMAKANPKQRKPHKRLNPSSFALVLATPTDAERYVAARSRVVYSYHIVKDKRNTPQVQQIEKNNLEIQRLARKFDDATEKRFFDILSENTKVLFLVKDSQDCGFAMVNFKTSTNTAYIGDLVVFRHLAGMGTIFYNLIENHIKSLGFTKITLHAPFDGSKIFWEKMGFIPDADGSMAYHKFL